MFMNYELMREISLQVIFKVFNLIWRLILLDVLITTIKTSKNWFVLNSLFNHKLVEQGRRRKTTSSILLHGYVDNDQKTPLLSRNCPRFCQTLIFTRHLPSRMIGMNCVVLLLFASLDVSAMHGAVRPQNASLCKNPRQGQKFIV